MVGKKFGKSECGIRLTQKRCPGCEHLNQQVDAQEVCAQCKTPLRYWCERAVAGEGARCDYHHGRTDTHPLAALTPDALVRRRLLEGAEGGREVLKAAEAKTAAERAEDLAQLSYAVAHARLGEDGLPDKDMLQNAVWAQERAVTTREHAAKAKALEENKLPELQTKRDLSKLTDDELAEAERLARKAEGRA